MLMDKSLVFAQDQSLAAAAASTSYVDLEQADTSVGMSKLLSVAFMVSANVTGTLQFKLQQCATANGDYEDILVVPTMTAPKAGTMVQLPLPFKTKQYVRAYFGGSPTAGKVTAFLTEGRQLWKAEAEASSVKSAFVTEQPSD